MPRFSPLKLSPVFFAKFSSQRSKFPRALQPFAAVHHDHFAIDVGATIADQKCSEIGQFLNRAKPAERIAIENQLLEIAAGQKT